MHACAKFEPSEYENTICENCGALERHHTKMTSTDEQQEARALDDMRKRYTGLRWVGRWSPKEKRLRLFRWLFVRGIGPGYGDDGNYSGSLSVAIEWKLADLWVGAFWKPAFDGWQFWLCIVPCLPIRLHLKRSWGGWLT